MIALITLPQHMDDIKCFFVAFEETSFERTAQVNKRLFPLEQRTHFYT